MFLRNSLIAATIALFISSIAFATEEKLTNEIAATTSKNDHLIEASTRALCNFMEPSECKSFKMGCDATPAKNYCFQRRFLNFAVIVERCGINNYPECMREQNEYEAKYFDFLDTRANKPGLARASVNICEPFGKVAILKPSLREVENNLKLVLPEVPPVIYDYKELYSCVMEQYLKMNRELLTK